MLDPNVMLSEQVRALLEMARKIDYIVAYGHRKPSSSYFASAYILRTRVVERVLTTFETIRANPEEALRNPKNQKASAPDPTEADPSHADPPRPSISPGQVAKLLTGSLNYASSTSQRPPTDLECNFEVYY
jgi:hypothetical protein